MRMYLQGEWQAGTDSQEVRHPFDGRLVDTVPIAGSADVERAIDGLVLGAQSMRALSPHARSLILEKVARMMRERLDDLSLTISLEEGKILAEARVEASRAADVIALSAEEARRITGEMIPLDGTAHGAGKLGFTLRVPCGVVAAITPFNFPLNLVAHKVGPAIAGGNAVLLKPASNTPLSALKFTEICLEAGLPAEAIVCLTGPGGELGQAICADPRVRKISFTGSYDVGDQICRMAGVKRVTMELGSNSPVVVMDDADLETAATAVCGSGFSNAGQVCISAQRILTHHRIAGDFLDALKPKVEALRTGDPLDPATKMGPMVRERDAIRVEQWVNEAVSGGARLVTGGRRRGAIFAPTILADVDPRQRISCEELFGPAVAVTQCRDIDEAIRLANDTTLGLSAAIFTQDIDRALRFAREVDSGNLHINWASQWRADGMPYGGLKQSGLGKEGPKYAIREMTEEKMVVLHLKG
jgi:glyceraldehyde-3-phosphate dehydrogenase (NADP+)